MDRTCTKCRGTFPASTEYFYKYRNKIGLMAWCIECHKSHMKQWKPSNPKVYKQKRAARQRARRAPAVLAERKARQQRLEQLQNAPTRFCMSCKTEKTKEAFVSLVRCQTCDEEENRRYVVRHWDRNLLRAARNNAKDLSVAFDLTANDIQGLWSEQNGRCFWFGILLVPSTERRGLSKPSLDRLMPELGYVRGNVVLTSWAANACRNEASTNTFQAFVQQLKSLWSTERTYTSE